MMNISRIRILSSYRRKFFPRLQTSAPRRSAQQANISNGMTTDKVMCRESLSPKKFRNFLLWYTYITPYIAYNQIHWYESDLLIQQRNMGDCSFCDEDGIGQGLKNTLHITWRLLLVVKFNNKRKQMLLGWKGDNINFLLWYFMWLKFLLI